MEEIRLDFKDILQSIEEILCYFSGKRAENNREYYRYAACESDRSLLIQLIMEGCSWIDLGLAGIGAGFRVSADEIIFSLKLDHGAVGPDFKYLAEGFANRRLTFLTLFRSILVRRVVVRWLLLAGYESVDSLELECSGLLAGLKSRLSAFSRLSIFCGPRYVPPM